QTTLDAMTLAYLTQITNPVTDFRCLPVLAQKTTDMVTGALKVSGIQYGDVVLGDLVTINIVNENQTLTSAQKRVAEIIVQVDENSNEEVRYTFSVTGIFVTATSLAIAAFPDLQNRIAELESKTGTGGGGSTTNFADNEKFTGNGTT